MADKAFSLWEFVFADLGAAALVNVLFKFIGEKGAEAIKKSLEEQRGELFAFIMTLKEGRASANLRRRQKERQEGIAPYKKGDEVRFIQLLTKLFAALDEPSERDDRKRVFTKLGMMSDKDFDQALTFLEHDVVVQWLRKFGGGVEQVGSWASKHITPVAKILTKELRAGNKDLRKTINASRARRGLKAI